MTLDNLVGSPNLSTLAPLGASAYEMPKEIEVVVKQLETYCVVKEFPSDYYYFSEDQRESLQEHLRRKILSEFTNVLAEVVQIETINDYTSSNPRTVMRAKLHLPLVYSKKMVDLETQVKYYEGKMNASEIKNTELKRELYKLTDDLHHLRLPFYKRWALKLKGR